MTSLKSLVGLLALPLFLFSAPCAADSFTYDAQNRLTRVAYANGTAIDYVYDPAGNLLSSENSTFGAPDAPTSVTVTPGDGRVVIGFTAPANNGGDAILSYTASSSPGGFAGSCTAPCSSITVEGLTNGTAYTFTVAATNSAGTSPASSASDSVIPVVPPVFTVSANAGENGTIAPATRSVTQGDTTSFTVTPNAGYTASVSGCGGSLSGGTYVTGVITGSCTVNATFTQSAVQLELGLGWNLVGNSSDAPINVATTFSDANSVTTVWKWIASQSAWAFHAPSLAAQGTLADYVASKGYQALTTIAGGEGFWVNAKLATTLNVPSGNPISIAVLGPTLRQGWNLAAIGEVATPKQFCDAQSGGVTTLWAWDATNSAWYFYAPSLDAGGNLGAYITGKGYLDFTTANKLLGRGVGFWVNKP